MDNICYYCQAPIPDGKAFKVTAPDGAQTCTCSECQDAILNFFKTGEAEDRVIASLSKPVVVSDAIFGFDGSLSRPAVIDSQTRKVLAHIRNFTMMRAEWRHQPPSLMEMSIRGSKDALYKQWMNNQGTFFDRPMAVLELTAKVDGGRELVVGEKDVPF